VSRINTGRLLLGGFVAGIVANALDFLTQTYLMTEESSEMIARLNLNPDTVAGSYVAWIVVDFLWGYLLTFAYVAMRPRFNPGPKTALVSGLTMWLGVTVILAGFTAMGVFTQHTFMKAGALTLVSSLAASLAGAAMYKE
jgi:hypothetical protein